MSRFNYLQKLLQCLGLCLDMPENTSSEISHSSIEEQRTIVDEENLKDISNHTTTSLLPLDVMLEILSGLPAKPLARCKCVCKSWCSAIQDRNFVEMNMNRNDCISIFEEDTSADASEVSAPYYWWDGLILEGNTTRKNMYLRNVVTGQKVKLPDPHSRATHMKFSYIRASKTYKLVHVHAKEGLQYGGCKVLTLGIDPTWRSIDIPSLHILGSHGDLCHSLAIGEVVFFSIFRTNDSRIPELIYLDLATEEFGNIKAPPVMFKNREKVSLAKWGNKLSLADHVDGGLHFWILEDYRKQKWAEETIILPSNFLEKYPDLPETLLPYSVNKGVLQFHLYKGHIITYRIASKEVSVTATPPGKKLVYLGPTSIVRIPESIRELKWLAAVFVFVGRASYWLAHI